MDFTDADSFNKALEMSGTEVGGYSLVVDEAKQRGDFGSGGGRSGGRGGRSGGRDFGRSGGRDFGRSGGRDGGRFGGRGRGGRDGGRGGRGRGTPNRPSLAAAGTGMYIFYNLLEFFLQYQMLVRFGLLLFINFLVFC